VTKERTPLREIAQNVIDKAIAADPFLRAAVADRVEEVTGGPRITIALRAAPACIAESITTTLAAHGLSLSDALLSELGRNTAQALVDLDESDA